MKRYINYLSSIALVGAVMVWLTPGPAVADSSALLSNWFLRGKATPDECSCGLTDNLPGGAFDEYGLTPPFSFTNPDGTCSLQCPAFEFVDDPAPFVGQPKPVITDQTGGGPAQPRVNSSYILSQSEYTGHRGSRSHIWFGTEANPHCTEVAILEATMFGLVDGRSPSEGGAGPCEYASSPYANRHNPIHSSIDDTRAPWTGTVNDQLGFVPGFIGDWRPPRVNRYNRRTKALQDMTPKWDPSDDTNPLNDISNAGFDLPDVFLDTLGWRATVVLGDLVIFAGPSLPPGQGANFIAFNARTGRYLGAHNDPNFDHVGQWSVVNRVGYLAAGDRPSGQGYLLRWKGTASKPFDYDYVGQYDGVGVYMIEHKGRLVIHTWPELVSANPSPVLAGIVLSPPLPLSPGVDNEAFDSNVNLATVQAFPAIWRWDQYEPDASIVHAYSGGALVSLGDYVIAGSIHIPAMSQLAWALQNPGSSLDSFTSFISTYRATSLIRLSDLANPGGPQVDLLYGLANLRQYDSGGDTFNLVPNLLGQAPLFGTAGILNPLNSHSMAATTYKLLPGFEIALFGTFDTSGLFGTSFPNFLPPEFQPQERFIKQGADLYMFISPEEAAIPLVLEGFDNPRNDGLPHLIATEDKVSVVVGTANPSNAAIGELSQGQEGGWELIEFKRGPILKVIRGK